MKKKVLILLTLVALSGCMSAHYRVLARRQNYIENNRDLSAKAKGIIELGKFYVGMSPDELRASVGDPYKIEHTGEKAFKWYYAYKIASFPWYILPFHCLYSYLFIPHMYRSFSFENGILNSWYGWSYGKER